ncbi:hypothetical protein SBA1_340040 [Candidatus Sulfotelmatobacter kueseliae]|uniref:Uncharacterized protein n=1 Tax=Candidatus Sulfotelmatobacter kueseliae TaxID=2042962 RepID=A0A2U3KMW7_9BACT|nr:hypothetical protein SBA1_340040 [Candidatus Sulfotelmatobacter kueseliae]
MLSFTLGLYVAKSQPPCQMWVRCGKKRLVDI